MSVSTQSAHSRVSSWHVPSFTTAFWEGRSKRVCVVIPVINEGSRIASLLGRIQARSITDIADVIIIDGGSTDGSLAPDMLRKNRVRGLLVKTGPGKLSAQLRCAYAFALEQLYQSVITIDGNDKDDPEAIASFVAKLEEGFDFVQASRYISGGIAENTPLMRILGIRLLHAPALSLASGFHWTDTTQGFRGYSSRVLLDPRVAAFRDVFVGYELLAYLSYKVPKLGYRCVELPTARRYPAHGRTPTKIGGLAGNLDLLRTLLVACTGGFDPKR